MTQNTFSVSENARVDIRHCHDRVTIVGWDDAHSIAVDYAARQDGDTLFIENANKVTVRVPRAATVMVVDCEADVRVDDLTGRVELTNIGGDVALRNLRGETLVHDVDGGLAAKDLTSLKGDGVWKGDVAVRDVKSIQVESIGGDLTLSEVEAATINQVEGDFVAKNVKSLKGSGVWESDVVMRGVESAQVDEIEGDLSLSEVSDVKLQSLGGDLSAQSIRTVLTIDDIKGDVSLREIGGRIVIERIGGDFMASNARGAISALDIDGDAVVSFAEVAELNLRADGDVVLNLPANANAEIELDAPRGDLVALANIQVTTQDQSHLHGKLGSGGVPLRAESTKSDLILRQNGTDLHKEKSGDYAEHLPHAVHMDFSAFADMGQRIAAEVRKSVHESLADMRVPEMRAHRHRFEVRMHRQGRHQEHRHERDAERESRREGAEEKPPRPEAGSPERKAILDAIARGELNVDDAIKKLTGEM